MNRIFIGRSVFGWMDNSSWHLDSTSEYGIKNGSGSGIYASSVNPIVYKDTGSKILMFVFGIDVSFPPGTGVLVVISTDFNTDIA